MDSSDLPEQIEVVFPKLWAGSLVRWTETPQCVWEFLSPPHGWMSLPCCYCAWLFLRSLLRPPAMMHSGTRCPSQHDATVAAAVVLSITKVMRIHFPFITSVTSAFSPLCYFIIKAEIDFLKASCHLNPFPSCSLPNISHEPLPLNLVSLCSPSFLQPTPPALVH